MHNELQSKNNTLFYINDKITTLISKLGNSTSDSEIKKMLSIFTNQISKWEKNNDETRLKKLENLRNTNPKNNTIENFVRVEVHNFSKKQIPSDIIDILSIGLDQAVGGIPRRNNILSKFELFYSAWVKHAVDRDLDLIKITEIKSLLYLEFLKFSKCATNSDKIPKLKKFLKENDDIIICKIDKSKNIGIYDRNVYLEKLNTIFEPEKFEKLGSNPLKSDIRTLKTLTTEFGAFLSKTDNRKIDPIESLKKGFGIVKLHRTGAPLRPIISSFNSLTSGSEQFFLNLIKPLISKCEFSVNSTKSFKEQFCAIKEKFNPQIHEVVSFDATALYTNIDVKRTVKYILKEIYQNVLDYFPISDDAPVPPPKMLTEKFMMEILLKYNNFETLNGFYSQRSGVAMGGKMSGALSNIFVNILEQKIVKKYIKNHKILYYVRFVDDCLLILRKRSQKQILQEFNNFDKDLNWTVEEMKNGSLTFLDTNIKLEDSTLNLYQHRKPNSSDSLTNYKYAVAPKAYKIGLISGEIHRANNCTSTDGALNEALNNLETILIKNSYPKKLIKQKIQDIKERNFKPTENKKRYNTEMKNPNLTHATVCLPYTSFRCSSTYIKL